MRRSYIVAGVIAVGVAGWVASGQFGETPVSEETAASGTEGAAKPTVIPRVRVRDSLAQSRKNELIVLGRTEASRRLDLRAETSGRIVAITKNKGELVEQGEVIARLAMDDRQARLRQAAALVKQREIEFQASKELSSRNFRSKVKLAETEANLATAKALFQNMKLDIQRTEIRAPFDGVLEKRPVEVGDYLAVGGAVATLVDLTPVLAVGNVTEQEVGLVKVGAAGRAKLVTGAIVNGRIRYVSTEATEATRTFRVEMEIDNSARSTIAGMTAEIRLQLEALKVHKVSPAVLTLADDGAVGVKAVDDLGQVQFHKAELVAEDQDGVWIAGLPDRLMIITVGQEFVRPGQKVEPVPHEAPVISRLKGQ